MTVFLGRNYFALTISSFILCRNIMDRKRRSKEASARCSARSGAAAPNSLRAPWRDCCFFALSSAVSAPPLQEPWSPERSPTRNSPPGLLLAGSPGKRGALERAGAPAGGAAKPGTRQQGRTAAAGAQPPPACSHRRYNAADGRGFATIDDGTLSFLSRQFGVLPVLLLPGACGAVDGPAPSVTLHPPRVPTCGPTWLLPTRS